MLKIIKKITTFVPKFEKFISDVYTFDNTFHENFVHLDGTNYENYQKNIVNIEITDEYIESLMKDNRYSMLERLNLVCTFFSDKYNNDPEFSTIVDKIKEYLVDPANFRGLKYFANGVSYKLIKNGSNTYIDLNIKKLKNKSIDDIAKYFYEDLGILSKKEYEMIIKQSNKREYNKLTNYINRLMNGDAEIISGDSKYVKRLTSGKFDDLASVIEKSNLSSGMRVLSDVKDAAKDDIVGEIKYIYKGIKTIGNGKTGIKEISGAINKSTVLEFTGKTLGVVDKAKTIYDNGKENLIKNGELDFNVENVTKAAADTGIDLLSSAAGAAIGTAAGAGTTAAVGAIVGSVVPGVGTVVGAAVGGAISYGLNNIKFGDPPESAVDHAKNWTNSAIEKIFN